MGQRDNSTELTEPNQQICPVYHSPTLQRCLVSYLLANVTLATAHSPISLSGSHADIYLLLWLLIFLALLGYVHAIDRPTILSVYL